MRSSMLCSNEKLNKLTLFVRGLSVKLLMVLVVDLDCCVEPVIGF